VTAVEAKSAETPTSALTTGLDRFARRVRDAEEREGIACGRRIVVYAGAETQERSSATLLAWSDLDRFDWSAGHRAGH
jgi:hypothetical protein